MMLHSRVACYSLVMLATIATRSAAQARAALQPISGALAARLDSIIDEFRNEQELPGLSIAVVTSNGRLLYGHGFGFADVSAHRPVTNRTLFPIYSISKVYASALAHRVAARGRLDLSAPVGRYLTALPAWRDTVTMRQLLAHTSGLDEYSDIKGYEESASAGRSEDDRFASLALQRPLRFTPGTQWRYSNTGYALAQSVMERVTDDSLIRAMREELFEPLGLKDTSPACPVSQLATGYTQAWRLGLPGDSMVASTTRNAHRYKLASGGLCSTASDVARFVAALLDGNVVDPAGLADMARRDPPYSPSGAGLFVAEDAEGLIYMHSGGGGNGNSEVMAFVRDSIVLAAITNAGPANFERLLRTMRREVLGLPHPVVEDLPLTRDEWLPLLGEYVTADTRERVAVVSEKDSQPFMFGSRMLKQADGSYVPPFYRDWRVAFRRLPDGGMELVITEYGVVKNRGVRRQ